MCGSGLPLQLVVGMLVGLFYAFMVVTIGADQVVTAVAMNLGAIGLSSMIYTLAFAGPGGVVRTRSLCPSCLLAARRCSATSRHRSISFNQLPLVYLAFLAVPLVWFILYRTTWGLKIRCSGRTPQAADVLGISVVQVRYLTTLVHRRAGRHVRRLSLDWSDKLFLHQYDRWTWFHCLYSDRIWPLATDRRDVCIVAVRCHRCATIAHAEVWA